MDLKVAITVVEIIVGIAVAMVIGDYIGYKFGRWQLFKYALSIALGVIVIFAIYAAISLNRS